MKSRLGMLTAVALAAALGLTACSSGSSSGGSSTSASLSSAQQQAADAAFKGVGGDPDLTKVTPAAAGLDFYVVSCGQSVPGCSVPAQAVADSAKAVGWKVTIADGALSPAGFAAAIRQAIAGGAKVIVPIGIGCAVAQAAFKEATDAHITIIGGGGVDDCSPKLWASERLWINGYTPQQQWEEFGKLQADYAIYKHGTGVKAISLTETTQVWGAWITDGFKQELAAKGAGSVVKNIDVSDPEQADGSYLQKVTTAILQEPDANTLIVPIDGWLSTGLASSIVQSGSAGKLTVIGRGGDAAVNDLIRKGNSGVTATIGFAVQWGGWGSTDTAIRILAGKSPVYIQEPMQAIDATHNLPASGAYLGGVDYASKFKTAWGVS